ncbi:hypothetical protein HDV01_004037 [Terramyces sp. JEL0728]|nr:hypothetical protein HDV01_004037 [Terramyces sp. JEL0728]
MVGHLTALEHVAVIPATELVLQKMDQVLKDAATVIQTYRKQSKISRRLNLGNKDKFQGCFTSIEKCSADLMFSLQIHQTHKLEELSKRKEDALDLEAEKFIKEHGGIENIKNNKELVKQFAAETKLTIDDNVMQELNSNISSLLIENQAAMETILKENLSTEISKGFEEFAKQMIQSDNNEVQLTCVQCGEKYKESRNPMGACSFHISYYDTSCCGNEDTPCQHKKHRPKHHNDYPYSTFFEMVYKIDLDYYIDIVDEGLEENLEAQECCVGKLLRWTRFSSEVNDDILVIRVGKILQRGPNFFNTYSASALQIISECYKADGNKLIYRNHQSNGEFSYAEWIFDENKNVIGVYSAVKSKTSSIPTAERVIFDPKTFESVSHERISTQYYSYQPESSYTLPKSSFVGRKSPEGQLRKERKFKTYGALQPHVYFSAIGDIAVNNPTAREGHDIYKGKLSLFNKTKETVVIMNMECEYRLIGDNEYAESVSSVYDINFPFAIEPLKSIELEYTVTIERNPSDSTYKEAIWNSDYLSRDRPLRLRFNATDMEDRVGHFVTEYLRYFPYRKTKKDTELEHLVLDDYDKIARTTVIPRAKETELDMDKFTLSFSDIDQKVYKALKNGTTEIELRTCSESNFDYKFWGLIDPNCRRIYAVKTLITQKEMKAGLMAYVAVPIYGKNKETRPIEYATEKVQFPVITIPPFIEYPNDDRIDDTAQEKFGKPLIPSVTETLNISTIPSNIVESTAMSTETLMEELGSIVKSQTGNTDASTEKIIKKLDAIEGQLSRTADSIGHLVGIFSKLARDRDQEKSYRQPSNQSLKNGEFPSMIPSTEFASKAATGEKEDVKLSMCF